MQWRGASGGLSSPRPRRQLGLQARSQPADQVVHVYRRKGAHGPHAVHHCRYEWSVGGERGHGHVRPGEREGEGGHATHHRGDCADFYSMWSLARSLPVRGPLAALRTRGRRALSSTEGLNVLDGRVDPQSAAFKVVCRVGHRVGLPSPVPPRPVARSAVRGVRFPA